MLLTDVLNLKKRGTMHAVEEFRHTIERAGLTVPEMIHADGKLHRFASNGDRADANTVLLCEGYATAASLYEATCYQVVMAFSAGNLTPVAEQVRQQLPTAVIVLAADNDLRTDEKPNVGLDAATLDRMAHERAQSVESSTEHEVTTS
jgi:hypothetical protein